MGDDDVDVDYDDDDSSATKIKEQGSTEKILLRLI
jgi:hypothetical protein